VGQSREPVVRRESHLRSVLKGISWRVLATSTTILIAGMFVGDWGVAAAIGGTEAVSKLFLYYVHERLWQLAPPGSVTEVIRHQTRAGTADPVVYRESRLRSVLKAATWRVVASGTTLGIAWGATSDAGVAAGIAGVELVSKLLLYYFHERAWQLLPRGTVRTVLQGRDKAWDASGPPPA